MRQTGYPEYAGAFPEGRDFPVSSGKAFFSCLFEIKSGKFSENMVYWRGSRINRPNAWTEVIPMSESALPGTEKSVCFTGHRPSRLMRVDADYFRLTLQNTIEEAIDAGYDTFYCGMAMGMDIVAGELTAALRQFYPWVRLVAVVPFPGQTDGWPAYWAERHRWLLNKADERAAPVPAYRGGVYQLRNRYMVDHAGRVIAVYNGSARGGTAQTIRYAQKLGREITILRPQDFCRKSR